MERGGAAGYLARPAPAVSPELLHTPHTRHPAQAAGACTQQRGQGVECVVRGACQPGGFDESWTDESIRVGEEGL